MKPGYQTTEFWTALGPQVLGLCVILGFVNAADAASLGGVWAKSVAAVVVLVGSISQAKHYVEQRIALKKAALGKETP